jgi:hypothetical protein
VSADIAVIFGLVLYKLACLAVGALFGWLGYRLFMAGIWGPSGNLHANFRDWKLILKSAAPGTFFVVLGAFIIVFTVMSGLKFDVANGGGSMQPAAPLNKAPSMP